MGYLYSLVIKLCILHAIAVKSQTLTRLGHLNVNKEFVTLSGFSSGGTFAQQLYISHSSLFSGIAVFSHTYYRCGSGNGILRDYDAVCTQAGNLPNNQLYDPNNALNDIHNYFISGLIDDPSHLANKPLYVFAGTANYLFTVDMSLRILQVFEPFIKNPHSVKTHVSVANLTLPSNRPDLPNCPDPPNSIQVSNCGFSVALESLQFLLGRKAVVPPQQRSAQMKMQPLLPFDQSEFFYGTDRNDMDNVGYVYVPQICQSNEVQCLLHFYFHGCSTGREFVGPDHILNSGYLQVAEANGIIMIFPQAVSSPENTIGCWDTFGVTGRLYATKMGPQVIVLKNILDRVLGKEFSMGRRPYSSEFIHGPTPSHSSSSSSPSSHGYNPFTNFPPTGTHSTTTFPMSEPSQLLGYHGRQTSDSRIASIALLANQEPNYFPQHLIKNMVIHPHPHRKSDEITTGNNNGPVFGTGNKCINSNFQRCFTN